MPVWGIWHGDAFFFSTGAKSRNARHLERDPRCSVTTDHAAEAVIVEGAAPPLRDAVIEAEFVGAATRWRLAP